MFSYESEQVPEPDSLVDCPFCKPPYSHQLMYKKINYHMIKIKKQKPQMANLITCKFNKLHVVNMNALKAHEDSCQFNPDYNLPNIREKKLELVLPVIHHNVATEEDWGTPATDLSQNNCADDNHYEDQYGRRHVFQSDAFNVHHLSFDSYYQ